MFSFSFAMSTLKPFYKLTLGLYKHYFTSFQFLNFVIVDCIVDCTVKISLILAPTIRGRVIFKNIVKAKELKLLAKFMRRDPISSFAVVGKKILKMVDL